MVDADVCGKLMILWIPFILGRDWDGAGVISERTSGRGLRERCFKKDDKGVMWIPFILESP